MKAGRVKIVNQSRYDDGEVKQLVHFGLQDLDVKGEKLLVLIQDTKRGRNGYLPPHFSGKASDRCIHRIPAKYEREAQAVRARFVIRVRVGGPERFPMKPWREYGLMREFLSWQEALVGVTAHEARHIQHAYDGDYQKTTVRHYHRNGKLVKRRRRIGSQRIEPKCVAYEQHVTRRFREEGLAAR